MSAAVEADGAGRVEWEDADEVELAWKIGDDEADAVTLLAPVFASVIGASVDFTSSVDTVHPTNIRNLNAEAGGGRRLECDASWVALLSFTLSAPFVGCCCSMMICCCRLSIAVNMFNNCLSTTVQTNISTYRMRLLAEANESNSSSNCGAQPVMESEVSDGDEERMGSNEERQSALSPKCRLRRVRLDKQVSNDRQRVTIA